MITGAARKISGDGCWVLFGCIVLWVSYARQVADKTMFSSVYFDDERGSSYRFLEGLPPGSRIAWFGPSNEYYPFYGRRLQFTPVVVEPDGTWRPPLRRLWEQDAAGVRWWGRGREPDPATLAQTSGLSGSTTWFCRRSMGSGPSRIGSWTGMPKRRWCTAIPAIKYGQSRGRRGEAIPMSPRKNGDCHGERHGSRCYRSFEGLQGLLDQQHLLHKHLV